MSTNRALGARRMLRNRGGGARYMSKQIGRVAATWTRHFAGWLLYVDFFCCNVCYTVCFCFVAFAISDFPIWQQGCRRQVHLKVTICFFAETKC